MKWANNFFLTEKYTTVQKFRDSKNCFKKLIVLFSDHQFGFMPRRSTTDAIYALCQLIEKFREGQQSLHCVY